MQSLDIKQTDNSPYVHLNSEEGRLLFEGKSYPENTFDFYVPILVWLKEYFTSSYKANTVVDIKLSYFNSATTQTLFDILDIIEAAEKSDMIVNWHYDANNENGKEDYEDFSEEFPDMNIRAVAL